MSQACFAINSKAIEYEADHSIKALYQSLDAMPKTSVTERIHWITNQLNGKVYILGSLGEGPNARFDQYPKYRMDGFDCDTYVTTVLALSLATSLKSFQNCLRFIRYKDGKVSYVNRNHFTSIDWNANNQSRGLLKDITLDIRDKQKQPVVLYAHALINKPSWYQYKKPEIIRLQQFNSKEQNKRLTELKKLGVSLAITPSDLPYIPLTALFDSDNHPNLYLFSQIPDGAIVEIVRPNWDLKKVIGTALNISHLGFVFWIDNQLYFRQASSDKGGVVEVSLIEYLREAKKSPTIKGINVQIILPSQPVSDNCQQFNNHAKLTEKY